MFDELHVWAIEVDKNHETPNLGAQQDFIQDFGRDLFAELSNESSPLSRIALPYFTRIFYPARDKMGAYVRLNFFVAEGDAKTATEELDRRLTAMQQANRVFQIKKEQIDAIKEAESKGTGKSPDAYYRFVHNLSRLAVELFQRELEPTEVESLVRAWSHNVSNLFRGS